MILEQIPGYVEINDVTSIVQKDGYWASYNIPFSRYIYDVSGYPLEFERDGPEYSWKNCSRANIFRRDSPKIRTTTAMQYIMQYNDYKNDPLSNKDPGQSIASRFDLDPDDPTTEGAYDAKITSHSWMSKFTASIISGPTHEQQPVFTWNPEWSHVLHTGQPDSWDFYSQLVNFYSN